MFGILISSVVIAKEPQRPCLSPALRSPRLAAQGSRRQFPEIKCTFPWIPAFAGITKILEQPTKVRLDATEYRR